MRPTPGLINSHSSLYTPICYLVITLYLLSLRTSNQSLYAFTILTHKKDIFVNYSHRKEWFCNVTKLFGTQYRIDKILITIPFKSQRPLSISQALHKASTYTGSFGTWQGLSFSSSGAQGFMCLTPQGAAPLITPF